MNDVSFQSAKFSAPVIFDSSDLSKASFYDTDLRGVDLSKAKFDSETKLPKRCGFATSFITFS